MGKMEQVTLAALIMMSCLTCAEAFSEMNICYILDSILIIYGFVLTILYCRLKVNSRKNNKQKKQTVDKGLYSGLTFKNSDIYETIQSVEKSKQNA